MYLGSLTGDGFLWSEVVCLKATSICILLTSGQGKINMGKLHTHTKTCKKKEENDRKKINKNIFRSIIVYIFTKVYKNQGM